MADWQPIETAPKDGTWILVYSSLAEQPNHFIASWEKFALPEAACGSEEEIDGEWTDQQCVFIPDPTHWMPLAEPPK